MIDISTYIHRSKMIKESYIIIDNIDDAEDIAKRVCCGENLNIKFATYACKNRFMHEVSIQRPDVIFVNCNSSKDKFFENVHYNTHIIFNNVEKCTDREILEFIRNEKSTFIC